MSVNLSQNRDGSLNLTFRAGETVTIVRHLLNDDGTPRDLRGHTFRCPITPVGASESIMEFEGRAASPAGDGVLVLVLPAVSSMQLSPGNYLFDVIDLYHNASTVILSGRMRVGTGINQYEGRELDDMPRASSRTFYVDAGNEHEEDRHHFSSLPGFLTALVDISYSPTRPIRVFSGLNADGTLIDWSAVNLAALADAGCIVHLFNEGMV